MKYGDEVIHIPTGKSVKILEVLQFKDLVDGTAFVYLTRDFILDIDFSVRFEPVVLETLEQVIAEQTFPDFKVKTEPRTPGVVYLKQNKEPYPKNAFLAIRLISENFSTILKRYPNLSETEIRSAMAPPSGTPKYFVGAFGNSAGPWSVHRVREFEAKFEKTAEKLYQGFLQVRGK